MSAAKIAQLLGNARREGRAWRCCCPLHNGRSLTLRDGDGGRLLVQCWGGCDRLDVLQELRRRGLLEGRTTDCRRGEVDNVRPPLPAMVALPLPAMVALPLPAMVALPLPAMVALVEHV